MLRSPSFGERTWRRTERCLRRGRLGSFGPALAPNLFCQARRGCRPLWVRTFVYPR